MANIFKLFGIVLTIVKAGGNAYEVCRVIEGVTVTFCDNGFYCCENKTRCCHDNIWSPVGIAALVIACLIGVAFIIFVIILCIKRNNYNKSQDQSGDTPTQEIEMVYTREMTFPPPYMEHLGPEYFASEVSNYLGQPPPYQPPATLNTTCRSGTSQDEALDDAVSTSGSRNEALCQNDESHVSSTTSTKKTIAEHVDSMEKIVGACKGDLYTESDKRIRDSPFATTETISRVQDDENNDVETSISVQTGTDVGQKSPSINNEINSNF